MKLFFSKILLAFYLLATCLSAQQASDQVMPETDTELAVNFESISTEVAKSLEAKAKGEPVFAKNWMVSVANPHAAAAGARVLSEGGTAADAMVAIQAVLGLVEPQSSGIGGGAFLVWYDGKSGETTTLDGRETAPLASTPRLFQNEKGERLKFWDAVVGGRSVGVPGTPALMEAAHKKWGQNTWNSLFSEAIDLAENGFAVSPRLAALVARDAERLGRFSDTAEYFFPNEQPLVEGDLLTNTAYADLMRRMAKDGAEVIYSGEIARAIIDTVRGGREKSGCFEFN